MVAKIIAKKLLFIHKPTDYLKYFHSKQPTLGLTQEFCWVTHASVAG